MHYKDFDFAVLRDIAEQGGTPSYVYSEATIRNQIRSISKLLDGFKSDMLFAMKANSHPTLLSIIGDENVGIDAVSPVELGLALRCGFSPDKILFSANNMTDHEMALAHESGVVLNIGELSRFIKFANAYPGSGVCVRINPERGAGHHAFVITAGKQSKFGIGLDQLDEMFEVANNNNIRIVGLHQHIGSGNLESSIIVDAMTSLLEIAGKFPDIEFINFGGGFGVPYTSDQRPLEIESLATLIRPILKKFLSTRTDSFRFLIEPGRYLVAESGVLLVRVTNIKRVGENYFAGTNSGMNHLIRPAIYGSHHEIINITNPTGAKQSYNVVGNICESSDFFALGREVSEIRERDVLAIMDTGAYGISMASTYNLRQLPAEMLIRENGDISVITKRHNIEATVDKIIDECSDDILTIS